MNSNLARLGAMNIGRFNDAVEHLSQNIQSSPQISQEKADDIVVLLNTLKVGMDTLSIQFDRRFDQMESRCHSSELGRNNNFVLADDKKPQATTRAIGTQAETEDDELKASIRRLTQLAKHDAHELYNEDADTVIEDLTRVVNTLFSPRTRLVPPQKRKYSTGGQESTVGRRDLKRICASVTASTNISINKRGEVAPLNYTKSSSECVQWSMQYRRAMTRSGQCTRP